MHDFYFVILFELDLERSLKTASFLVNVRPGLTSTNKLLKKCVWIFTPEWFALILLIPGLPVFGSDVFGLSFLWGMPFLTTP